MFGSTQPTPNNLDQSVHKSVQPNSIGQIPMYSPQQYASHEPISLDNSFSQPGVYQHNQSPNLGGWANGGAESLPPLNGTHQELNTSEAQSYSNSVNLSWYWDGYQYQQYYQPIQEDHQIIQDQQGIHQEQQIMHSSVEHQMPQPTVSSQQLMQNPIQQQSIQSSLSDQGVIQPDSMSELTVQSPLSEHQQSSYSDPSNIMNASKESVQPTPFMPPVSDINIMQPSASEQSILSSIHSSVDQPRLNEQLNIQDPLPVVQMASQDNLGSPLSALPQLPVVSSPQNIMMPDSREQLLLQSNPAQQMQPIADQEVHSMQPADRPLVQSPVENVQVRHPTNMPPLVGVHHLTREPPDLVNSAPLAPEQPVSNVEALNNAPVVPTSSGQFGSGPDIIHSPPVLEKPTTQDAPRDPVVREPQIFVPPPQNVVGSFDGGARPPDVIRTDPVPASDRNLFMQTGHLETSEDPEEVDLPDMDRLVLGESENIAGAAALPIQNIVAPEEARFVPGISSQDKVRNAAAIAVNGATSSDPNASLVPKERSEAVGSDKQDIDDTIYQGQAQATSHGRGQSRRGSEDDGHHRHNRSSAEYSTVEHNGKDSHRPITPTSDEMDEGRFRRHSYNKHDQSHGHRRRHHDKSYYEDSSNRSSYREKRRSHRSHRDQSYYHHQNYQSSRYDYSRPSSRSSNYDYDYRVDSSRRRYMAPMHDPYVAYASDPILKESFKQNWDYYKNNPAQLENLRINNPLKYSSLLRCHDIFYGYLPVLNEKQDVANRPSSRNSVHSGRSSVATGRTDKHLDQMFQPQDSEQESTIHPPLLLPEESFGVKGSVNIDELTTEDLTPLKFSSPHIKGSFDSRGNLMNLLAKNPTIGQISSINFLPLKNLPGLDIKGIHSFPGPLVPGVTHKGEVIRFCQNKISSAKKKDIRIKASYILIWELMILLLRQKNTIDGSDIAELLLKDRPVEVSYKKRSSINSERNEEKEDEYSNNSEDENLENCSEEVITARFRDYLLFGHKKEGLEYAMKHGLWGHALFLASKMDERSYSYVMLRFANGVAVNDPIQTVYQQMSGRQPIAMKECADPNWGDWRPHLAMILSNPSSKEGLDYKSIVTLGDTLLEKGDIFASHFCYIMASCEFGSYYNLGAKLALIGSDHKSQSYKAFLENIESFQLTEIFEYAQKLSNPEHAMVPFQYYKFNHVLKLIDYGASYSALHYLEIIALVLSRNLSYITSDNIMPSEFLRQILELGDRLKYLDPMYTTKDGELSEVEDPGWLISFREILTIHFQPNMQTQENAMAPTENQYYGGESYYQEQPEQAIQENSEPIAEVTSQVPADNVPMVPMMPPSIETESSFNQSAPEMMVSELPPTLMEASQPPLEYPPSISSPVQLPPVTPVSHLQPPVIPSEQRAPIQETKSQPPPPVKKSNQLDGANVKKNNTGVFGRLLSRFVPGMNNAHLPDDKVRSIVWDETKKKWVDTNADSEEEAAANAPPPSDKELFKSIGGDKGAFTKRGPKGLRGRVDVFKNSMSAPAISNMAMPPPPSLPLQTSQLAEAVPSEPTPDPNGAPPMFFNPSQFAAVSAPQT